MLTPESISMLVKARRRVLSNVWQSLIDKLSVIDSCPTPATISEATSSTTNRDAAWLLSDAFARNSHLKWSSIAVAMAAVHGVVSDQSPATEVIWTGPVNGRFPVRRIEQVLYDLITAAQRRIILVTFAANRVGHLCTHLTAAVERGVDVTLIVESENESEGQLTVDALKAFRDLPLPRIKVLYWPTQRRERNQANRPGKLHAKCAIVDDSAIVGSANLTDDAFNRNMELAVLVCEPEFVHTLAAHLVELQQNGVLELWKQ